ncbi:Brefeldin A resistance protein [Dictyocoela muelleri]|nr:Brefeldin A resistance protein [Dictyocoela muelleri]
MLKKILKRLDMIVLDFMEGFQDLRNLKFPEWMLCPIEVDVCTIKCQLQPEFLEIQNDEIFKVRFNTDGVNMWLSNYLKVNILFDTLFLLCIYYVFIFLLS